MKDAVTVFYDARDPDAPAEAVLEKLMPTAYRVVDAPGLAGTLEGSERGLLVSFHGGRFPVEAWEAVQAFLGRGGNLAVFGGVPFSEPVAEDGRVEDGLPYTDALLLGSVLRLETPPTFFEKTDAAAFLEGFPLTPAGEAGTFWAFRPQLTQVPDYPDEPGSSGPLDTSLTPLVRAVTDAEGPERRVATPVLLLEHHSGRYANGRWLIAAWRPSSPEGWEAQAEAVRRFVRLAAEKPSHLEVRPALACLHRLELPELVVTARSETPLDLVLTVRGPGEQGSGDNSYDSAARPETLRLKLPPGPSVRRLSLPRPAAPGLYEVEVRATGSSGLPLESRTGFWVWDDALARTTKRLTAGRDWLLEGGAPLPVFGTTYMDSAVQRHFLTLPNPARWDRDFAELRAAGVNTVRTGIWTGWRAAAPLAGVFSETFLRALDSFVMTACRHDLHVIFTLFAFSPPAFGGENPWFDPRSARGQQDFAALLAARYAQVGLVSWDLINEPSLGAQLWSERPVPSGDAMEASAFRSWLQARNSLSALRRRWRLTPTELPDWAQVDVPQEADFSVDLRDERLRHAFRAADFTRFTQDAFTDWAAGLRDAIRVAGNEGLVGVGQDEAEGRPAPLLHARALDYTSQHPWWRNDALLWDLLLAKAPGTPSLAQEVGVMTAPRDLNGHFWRGEEANAALLEQKLYLALAGRAAGVVQWLWHTNAVMTSANETGIGLVRADGSAKPELGVFLTFGRLLKALKDEVLEPEPTPPVWLVIPFAQAFALPRPSREATQGAVRALAYGLGVVPQLVADVRLKASLEAARGARTLVLPGAQLTEPSAWEALLELAAAGATVLVTGVLGRDPYDLPIGLGVFEAEAATPVSRFEPLYGLPDGDAQVVFSGKSLSYLKKAHNHLRTFAHGAGKLMWCGLPLEGSASPAALRAVYRAALGLEGSSRDEKPLLAVSRPLRNGRLLLLVNEGSSPAQHELEGGGRLEVLPNRAGAVLFLKGETVLYGGLRNVDV